MFTGYTESFADLIVFSHNTKLVKFAMVVNGNQGRCAIYRNKPGIISLQANLFDRLPP